MKTPLPTCSRPLRSQFTGQSSPFSPNINALSSSGSSGSSSRAISIASNSSGSSTAAPPMTKEDAKIIFNNVADLALFSDLFTERLEEALGSVLEGGSGKDRVGALFLEMVCVFQACPQTRVLIRRVRAPDSPIRTSVPKVHHATPNGSRTPEQSPENAISQCISRTYTDSRLLPHPRMGPPFSSHQTRSATSEVLTPPQCHY